MLFSDINDENARYSYLFFFDISELFFDTGGGGDCQLTPLCRR